MSNGKTRHVWACIKTQEKPAASLMTTKEEQRGAKSCWLWRVLQHRWIYMKGTDGWNKYHIDSVIVHSKLGAAAKWGRWRFWGIMLQSLCTKFTIWWFESAGATWGFWKNKYPFFRLSLQGLMRQRQSPRGPSSSVNLSRPMTRHQVRRACSHSGRSARTANA